jgi:hypothetical protein
MANPDILYKGIPRTPTRSYTAEVLRTVPPLKVVIPCTGSNSLAWAAVQAGVDPKSIITGDISLYSTALGNAIMGVRWPLTIKAGVSEEQQRVIAPLLGDPVTQAVAVMWTIRLLQQVKRRDTPYLRAKRRELIVNAAAYIEQLQQQIENMVAALHGITYVARDMWETMSDELNQPGTVALVNPPRYTSGYDRMFAGIDQVFEWDEPKASQFAEKDYPRLMDFLKEKPALSLMYYATQGEDPALMWGDPWRSVFADRPSKLGATAAINWIVANRDPIGVEANRGRIHEGKAKFRLFDGPVTEKSDLRAVTVPREIGDYYKDIFIHRLPGANTERYVALLLDGYLMGIIGLHLSDMHRHAKIRKQVKGQEKILDGAASVTFAFTNPHPTYDRLHKLTLMSLVSDWFWANVLGDENWYTLNGGPKNVKTMMITRHPEVKSARGVFTLDERNKQKDGTYKLAYSSPVHGRTREALLKEWIAKFSQKAKT